MVRVLRNRAGLFKWVPGAPVAENETSTLLTVVLRKAGPCGHTANGTQQPVHRLGCRGEQGP